ncbi:MAG TPA: urea ABC transporter permease subunit UrtB [Polyangiaceae bacterium]|nr:urea ABC transporter permease subunit UrtB [Polyangiaceae bacterium]
MRLLLACVLALLLLAPARARADELAPLVTEDRAAAATAIDKIAARRDAASLKVLEALQSGTLRVDAQGHGYAAEDGKLRALSPGAPAQPSPPLKTPLVDNRLRRALDTAVAGLKLSSPEREVRLAAARELSKGRNDELAPLVRQALSRETDEDVRERLAVALAHIDLASDDPKRRITALQAVEAARDPAFKPELERLAGAEKDEAVRRAASSALAAIKVRVFWFGLIGHLFYGVSLGSVLLLAALGLAITFGLMRVINMAHGELLMIGAYSTFVVQNLFAAHAPAYLDFYLVLAVPVAFVVSAAVGVALEATVLRRLYGRPLETLLATWGISLILIQTVRLIFGAQNVTVANPSWLSGGVELLPDFVLTYSRLAVIAFSALVIAFVWLMLQKSSLGLRVRAVTQNRDMAASMGISTRRVDMWTFGIGSGVAGLGGVALSQLGNVGPELGQAYIVDSFMVVVLGGVGKLAGTLAGALGLGIVNKLLEPAAGAVLGKIAILIFLILFIQRRPQGIFALKGRAAEVS